VPGEQWQQAAVGEAEHVDLDALLSEHVRGRLRLADPDLAVAQERPGLGLSLAAAELDSLDEAVACSDDHGTHGAALGDHALREPCRSERLVIRVRRNDQEPLALREQ
jgi:hypothetical protein